MKIACSSAGFARSLADGTLTQIEWLDVCANELEVDGVVFDARHFPRTDDDYLAHLKKVCVDLGLTVAAVATSVALTDDYERQLAATATLGAPLLICGAPPASADPLAWGAFAGGAKNAARAAKRANVTLAVRGARGTLCESSADLRRLANDVDSAWLRFVCDEAAFGADDVASPLLPRAVIATHEIADVERFATASDREAQRLNAALARFRGFVVLESAPGGAQRAAYHAALARFAHYRAASLVAAT